MKILNLYAGIGGNRKLWGDEHDITAIELDPKIAKIYQDFFPNDKVIITDAHQYLLEHFKEYEFIWSSPPCPTHSRMCNLNYIKEEQGQKPKYPDMNLWAEIILLKHWFEGKFCVENVITYYDPLIQPIESNNHYFWTNFLFRPMKNTKRGIRRQEMDFRKERVGFDISVYGGIDHKRILNNCVEPELGLHILNHALKKEKLLFDLPKVEGI